MKQRVYITGMGVINAVANSIAEFEKSLREGHRGIGFLQNKSGAATVNIGAEIRGFSYESTLQSFASHLEVTSDFISRAKKCAQRSPVTIQVATAAILEAYVQAHLFHQTIITDKIGIIVAGSNLTSCVQAGLYSKFQQAPEYLSPFYALQFMDTDHIGTLSEIFNITGEGFTVGGASASGNVGIIKGFQLVQMGIVDACVVVGALADLTSMELQSFYNVGAMGGKKFSNAPEKACRPFDQEHEGFIYGQACGCLILESGESAERRGISPIAEMLGGSIILDGNRLSNPNENGEVKAMESALRVADITVEEVDYINTHGSSSPLGDATEINAIKKLLKEGVSRVWINSTKGLTGHCLFSAGVVEAIASIIQMNSGFIHPNINLENPIDSDVLFVGKISTKAAASIAMSNSFGFGGINTSIVLGKLA